MHIPFQDKMQYWRKMGYIFSIVALYTRKDFQRFAGLEKACKFFSLLEKLRCKLRLCNIKYYGKVQILRKC